MVLKIESPFTVILCYLQNYLISSFQTDKDLVYDFIREGGLTMLIELGEDEEAQLQK